MVESDYTQIPNEILRNPDLSAKAKGILCLLLSNKYGWKGCVEGLCKLMRNNKESIITGLKELTEQRYFINLRYREKDTKKWRGSFWAYTNQPGVFDITNQYIILQQKKLEIYTNNPDVRITKNPQPGFPHLGFPQMENPQLIILIYNNTIHNKKADFEKLFEKLSSSNDFEDILPKDFHTPILTWLRYKSQKRQNYKPEGMKSLLKRICKDFSTADELEEAVDFSMANNWAGLFQPSKDKKTNRYRNKIKNKYKVDENI